VTFTDRERRLLARSPLQKLVIAKKQREIVLSDASLNLWAVREDAIDYFSAIAYACGVVRAQATKGLKIQGHFDEWMR
jgi:hypothetical protein